MSKKKRICLLSTCLVLLLILTHQLFFFGVAAAKANANTIDASIGPMIDVFTQKQPYSGIGANVSSDAFEPLSVVVLYASVTYSEDPVANQLVTFLIYAPNSYSDPFDIRTAMSDESGIAVIDNFRLPGLTEYPKEIVFGTWFVRASVKILPEKKEVIDTLTFKVGYIVEIVSIATINENLKPKEHFAKGTCVGVKLQIKNIAMLPKTATIIVTAYSIYDNNTVPFASIAWNDFIVESGETYIFTHCFLNISGQAAIGNAVVIASAYTAEMDAYCPSVSAEFVITRRDVAVVNVTASSVDVIAGQIVNITVTVTNKGNETETFSVSTYYGSFPIQTLSVESLSPNQNRTITFVWNTTYVSPGSYTIMAIAETLRGETETGDNTYIDDAVMVRYPRVFIFPRDLSIIALIVAAAAALLAIILLIIKRKKDTSQLVMLTVDVLPQ